MVPRLNDNGYKGYPDIRVRFVRSQRYCYIEVLLYFDFHGIENGHESIDLFLRVNCGGFLVSQLEAKSNHLKKPVSHKFATL